MAFNKITEKPEVTVKKSDLDVLITQTETVGGENVVALRRMKAATFLAELTADISSLDSADIMLAMDGYISPTINGIKNYRDGNVYHKKIGRVDLGSLTWGFGKYTADTWYVNGLVTTNNYISQKYEKANLGSITAGQIAQTQDILIVNTGSDTEKPSGYLYYELATEITRNIDGNEITVVERNAGAHTAIYRGRYLGSSVTDAQYTAIAQGTFDDLYIGDYWTIGGVNWRIAGFDYYYNTGDTDCTTHHAVIVPDTCLYNGKMNDTATTEGGYVGSKMYTEGLESAKSTINSAFSGHVLSHRVFLTNAVSNYRPSDGEWRDSTVELMNEQMVYGCGIFIPVSTGGSIPKNHRVEKSQLPLFAHNCQLITNRSTYWLRDVVSSSSFSAVRSDGQAIFATATTSYGSVRPAFCIK